MAAIYCHHRLPTSAARFLNLFPPHVHSLPPGQQTAPPEPKPPEEVDDSLDDAVLVVDESGGEDATTVDKADSSTSSNHVDSESSKEKKGNKKQSILDSGSGVKGQRHEPLAYERGINGHNSELKRAIVKEVRRPGNGKSNFANRTIRDQGFSLPPYPKPSLFPLHTVRPIVPTCSVLMPFFVRLLHFKNPT